MDRTRVWRILIPARIRHLPEDLQVVTGYLLVTTAVTTLPVIRTTILRPALALPLMVFIPGYLFIAALFPEAGTRSENEADTTVKLGQGIDWVERVALSFGTSIAIVPLLGLLLNFTPFGIRLGPIMVVLLLFCLGNIVIAAQRRRTIPSADRFTVDVRGTVMTAWSNLTTAESQKEQALNILLVCSVLLAVGSVGYAVAVPKQGAAFSEFYLLTETEDGERVADEYPTELTRGEPTRLVVGIGNHEHESVNYTVVVALQRVTIINDTDSNTTTVQVQEQRELRQFTTELADNSTWQQRHTIEPTLTGERLRLVYLLYRGPPPTTPTAENAYHEVHLWVNVSAPSTRQLPPDEFRVASSSE